MAKLNSSEIAGYASQAGIPANGVAIATAIALAESGGKTDSHNPVPPDNSYGLWQINMLAHSKKELGISRNEDLYDPSTNAKAMFKISNGGKNWKPWTTYTRGTYLKFMTDANAGAGTVGGSVKPVDSGSSLGSLGSVADKISDSHFWARIGEYLLGFLLIVIGLVMMGLVSKAQSIGKVAAAVNKVAK